MKTLTLRLWPATPNGAIFHRGMHHVNLFPVRAAYRCVHHGSIRESGDPFRSNELKSEGTEDKADGTRAEYSSSLKTKDLLGPVAWYPEKAAAYSTPSAGNRQGRHENFDAGRWHPRGRYKRTTVYGAMTHVRIGTIDRKSRAQYVKKAGVPRKDTKGQKNILKEFSYRDKLSVEAAREKIRQWQNVMKETNTAKSRNKDLRVWAKREVVANEEQLKIRDNHMLKRSLTIECNFPEQVTKKALLEAIPVPVLTKSTLDYWAREATRLTVVLLFTPSFAALVENDAAFVPDLLEALLGNMPKQTDSPHAGIKPLTLDVICACVDGLSPSPDKIPTFVGKRPKEGFSILFGPESSSSPSLWDKKPTSPSTSPSMQSSITFRRGLKGQLDLTLPLANTLFKTGRLSTLLISRWNYNDAKRVFFAVKGPVERSNVSVDIYQGIAPEVPESFIPAVPLTPFRPIVNGLGNIVRTIDFGGEDGIGPASRELESTVTKYLNDLGYGNTTIDVWALVVLPISGSTASDLELTATSDEIQRKWLASENYMEESRLVGSLIANRGAKLCRVLSGGGGWGAKQGLLSLDPQITYSEIPEARFDFSGGSLEEQQISALGNVAQEGAYIQFLVARRDGPKEIMKRSAHELYNDHMIRHVVFGAVPSTVDDITKPASEAKVRFEATQGHPFLVKTGHFGFVSESGTFLHHRPQAKPDQPPLPGDFTKIDLPYSYFCTDYRVPVNEEKTRELH